MNIHAIPALSDNYIWLIEKDNQAIVIDPAVSDKVLDFLKDNQLSLSAIWLTHEHNDHIGGVAGILEQFPDTPIYCHSTHYTHKNIIAIDDGLHFTLLGKEICTFETAGHTKNHQSFGLLNNGKAHIFCGDTLFRAGCGRVFTGTIDKLYKSFCLFNELDDFFTLLDKRIYFYPAHEYTLSNLKFGQFLEPNNADIATCIEKDMQLRANKLPTLPTTLQMERQINPFLRALNPNDELFENALKNGFKGDKNDRLALFAFLRELKNTF